MWDRTLKEILHTPELIYVIHDYSPKISAIESWNEWWRHEAAIPYNMNAADEWARRWAQ